MKLLCRIPLQFHKFWLNMLPLKELRTDGNPLQDVWYRPNRERLVLFLEKLQPAAGSPPTLQATCPPGFQHGTFTKLCFGDWCLVLNLKKDLSCKYKAKSKSPLRCFFTNIHRNVTALMYISSPVVLKIQKVATACFGHYFFGNKLLHMNCFGQ